MINETHFLILNIEPTSGYLNKQKQIIIFALFIILFAYENALIFHSLGIGVGVATHTIICFWIDNYLCEFTKQLIMIYRVLHILNI